MRFLFFLILFIGQCCYVSAQSYDLLLQGGKVIQNYPTFPDASAAAITRFSYNRILSGSAPWHRYYGNPEFALQGLFGSLGNKNELGNIAGVTGGLQFSRTQGNRISWMVGINCGLAYYTKPYNEISNPFNVAIGNRFTELVTADAGLYYHISPFVSLTARAAFLHGSDSHYQLPNVGINLPMFAIGVRYRPSPAVLISNYEEADNTNDRKIKICFRVGLGLHEQGESFGPVNGPKYPVYVASTYIYKHYSPVARWQTGIEGFYKAGYYAYITSQRYYTEKERLRSMCLVYLAGHEYVFGHLTFLTQAGVYIYNPFARDIYREEGGDVREFIKTWLSARLGFQYYVFNTYSRKHKNIFVGMYVKTNFGGADFLETGLGYNF